jgi:hypothetical protein
MIKNMWNKFKEKYAIYLFVSYFIIGVCVLLYLPLKCGMARIQNPPSKIYAENQILDKWRSFCIDGESENGCELSGYRLITKSKLGPMREVPIYVISVIEVDENYEELSITLKDWKTGEIIQPYPQEKEKWYQFNKKYKSFETIGTLFDEDGNDIISYEVTLMRNKIIITKASCDSRGYEEKNNRIKGGCFFLEDYEKNTSEWHSLDIILKDNRKALINL